MPSPNPPEVQLLSCPTAQAAIEATLDEWARHTGFRHTGIELNQDRPMTIRLSGFRTYEEARVHCALLSRDLERVLPLGIDFRLDPRVDGEYIASDVSTATGRIRSNVSHMSGDTIHISTRIDGVSYVTDDRDTRRVGLFRGYTDRGAMVEMGRRRCDICVGYGCQECRDGYVGSAGPIIIRNNDEAEARYGSGFRPIDERLARPYFTLRCPGVPEAAAEWPQDHVMDIHALD